MEFKSVQAKITDPKVGLTKAEHYCAYQERSQQEVRDKLYNWGLYPRDVEQIISNLIENNFLNEERFAKAYVKGKFSQKGWGRIKIKQGLKLKKVPEVLIRKALLMIDADDYIGILTKTIEKKARLLTEKDAYKRRYKLQQYAMGRGFESDLIADLLKDLNI
ncbi:regulatory protein RecX [Mucilaginibacter sp. AW1-3]